MFKALVGHGARLDIESHAGTLLHIAIRQNHQQLVEILIHMGIEVDKPDELGMTPLSLAAACGRLEIMELLLANGADMTIHDHNDQSPLDTAVKKRQDEAAELLLRRGADPSYVATHSSDLLFDAIERDMVRVTRFLLENGLEPDVVDRRGHNAVLVAASEACDEAACEIAEMFLRTGLVDVNARDAREAGWQTPLMWATIDRNARLVRLLLCHGANVDDRDVEGRTALATAACSEEDEGIYKILLKAGADINSRDNHGETP